jgi:hypothetical protein
MSTERPPAATIRVQGPATAEDVAAVVAVLASGGERDPEPSRPTSTWASHVVTARRPVDHGPGAWRTTYRR